MESIIDNYILLKKLGLPQPDVKSLFKGEYIVNNNGTAERWSYIHFIHSHVVDELQIVAYSPTLEEFWSFLNTKIPNAPFVIGYDPDKKTYAIAAPIFFPNLVEAVDPKDALMSFFLTVLFSGPAGEMPA